ncbi:MAG: ABC transporter permease, partial [Actinobacteria bacterium]|nr:ABC transporter permease [Actinomycetota bacterium]
VTNLFDMTFDFMELGITILIMTFIIIIGQIDLSLGSNMALSSAVMGISYQMGLNIWIAVLLGLCVGTFGGFFNGIIITKVKIHSIIITLATYSLFRGIAYILLKDKAVTGYPPKFLYLSQGYIGNSPVPVELAIFVVLAILFGFILHKSTFGRYMYSIGNNELASRYSGIPVDRIVLTIYTAAGFMSALAGVLFTFRVNVTRPNMAETFLFEIITIVLLGGVSIYGGEGSIIGVVLSLFLIGMIRRGMALINIPSEIMSIVIGCILIIAILIPRALRRVVRE